MCNASDVNIDHMSKDYPALNGGYIMIQLRNESYISTLCHVLDANERKQILKQSTPFHWES